MTADEVVQRIIAKHKVAYDAQASGWTGFGLSCWFGQGQRETVRYFYRSPDSPGEQAETPSVFADFRSLKLLLEDPSTVHGIVITYAKDTNTSDMRIIRDPEEAAKYQNSFGNPFDIAAAIRPPGV